MAFFGKGSAGSAGSAGSGDGAGGAAQGGRMIETSLSIIAAGMRISGDIESGGVIKIDGRVDGSVVGARQILLGRGGAIHGNVEADEVVIGGDVFGSVRATNRLELQGTATVQGNIDTKSIVVMEGAQITGNVRMSELVPVGGQSHQ
jgi:cytoskeletal protein CcmA (bactofilin family)